MYSLSSRLVIFLFSTAHETLPSKSLCCKGWWSISHKWHAQLRHIHLEIEKVFTDGMAKPDSFLGTCTCQEATEIQARSDRGTHCFSGQDLRLNCKKKSTCTGGDRQKRVIKVITTIATPPCYNKIKKKTKKTSHWLAKHSPDTLIFTSI